MHELLAKLTHAASSTGQGKVTVLVAGQTIEGVLVAPQAWLRGVCAALALDLTPDEREVLLRGQRLYLADAEDGSGRTIGWFTCDLSAVTAFAVTEFPPPPKDPPLPRKRDLRSFQG